MKIKNIAYITAICIMVFSVLGTVAVFAPPQTPLLPAPIEVVNPPDSTLEVTTPEGQSLDVTLDEPIEVINDEGDSLDVEVKNFPSNVAVVNDVGTSLDVAVNNFPNNIAVNNFPNSIDVENTLDVSGWLHTTESGSQDWVSLPTSAHSQLSIDTDGYREVTIVFDCTEDTQIFEVAWMTDGRLYFAESWTYDEGKPDDVDTRYFFKTYPIQGETMIIYWGPVPIIVDLVSITYYMTT